MRVLVAPAVPPTGDDDFCWCEPGELVVPMPSSCTAPGCGCDRAVIGARSMRGTTVAEVAEVPLTYRQLGEEIRAYLSRSGYLPGNPEDAELLVTHLAESTFLASYGFEVGDRLRTSYSDRDGQRVFVLVT